MRLIAMFLAASSCMFGSVIVSAQSGNWNLTSTWTGAAIPVSGDTVTISAGHTVTIPSGYQAIVGASGPGGGQRRSAGTAPDDRRLNYALGCTRTVSWPATWNCSLMPRLWKVAAKTQGASMWKLS